MSGWGSGCGPAWCSEKGETATAEEIIAFCRQQLIAYKVPAEVEFRHSLPPRA